MLNKCKARTLDQFKEAHYGQRGTPKRDQLEQGFEAFRLGALLQEARRQQGLTQQQLAERCGTNKAAISRLENNQKEVRLSTLQRIVE